MNFITSGTRMWACTSMTTGLRLAPLERRAGFAAAPTAGLDFVLDLVLDIALGLLGLLDLGRAGDAREVVLLAALVMSRTFQGCCGRGGRSKDACTIGWARERCELTGDQLRSIATRTIVVALDAFLRRTGLHFAGKRHACIMIRAGFSKPLHPVCAGSEQERRRQDSEGPGGAMTASVWARATLSAPSVLRTIDITLRTIMSRGSRRNVYASRGTARDFAAASSASQRRAPSRRIRV